MPDRSLFSFQKKSSLFLQKTPVFLKKDKENASFQLLIPARSWVQPLHADWCRRNHTEQVPTKFNEPSPNVAALVRVIDSKQIKVSDMMEALGMKHRHTFRVNYLDPAVESGFVAMLYPNSPRHPRQRYLLTPKGLMYFNAHQADDRR